MIDFSLLTKNFDNISINNNKITIQDNLLEILKFLKDTPELHFEMLTSIVAVDLGDYIELIYQLYSLHNNEILEISYKIKDFVAPSVIDVYPSAYFDECEIYDLFGVNFDGNIKLKRFLLPNSWVGNPLLKSYEQKDERLVWND